MLSIKNQIKYWQESAAESYGVMLVLKKGGKYPECLFFGHLVLEKILKAFVVLQTKQDAPKIHNLARLVELSGLELDKDTKEYLLVANSFNIRARYDDYKKSFYKVCTKEYTENNLEKITKIYNDLCQQLKSKKL
jgi:HEPN domain-containing protein